MELVGIRDGVLRLSESEDLLGSESVVLLEGRGGQWGKDQRSNPTARQPCILLSTHVGIQLLLIGTSVLLLLLLSLGKSSLGCGLLGLLSLSSSLLFSSLELPVTFKIYSANVSIYSPPPRIPFDQRASLA